MIDGAEMESFLREGLKHYREAKEAVDLYEHQISESLASIFEDTEWTNFKKKRGGRGRGKAIWLGDGSSEGGRYICASLGSESDDSSIDLGLWWGSPKNRDGVVMYCGFWRGGQMRGLQLETPTPPVRCEPIARGRARLFVVANGEFDLESSGRTLLADLDRALGKTEVTT